MLHVFQQFALMVLYNFQALCNESQLAVTVACLSLRLWYQRRSRWGRSFISEARGRWHIHHSVTRCGHPCLVLIEPFFHMSATSMYKHFEHRSWFDSGQGISGHLCSGHLPIGVRESSLIQFLLTLCCTHCCCRHTSIPNVVPRRFLQTILDEHAAQQRNHPPKHHYKNNINTQSNK